MVRTALIPSDIRIKDRNCVHAVMTIDTGSMWTNFGETNWPEHDVFSDDSFEYGATSNSESIRSELNHGYIRLVQIEPGDAGSMIRCHTKVSQLACTEGYTALSYTWGSALLSQPIEVDGRCCLVPRNLWRFLKQARDLRSQFSAWIWIDMLSIDQACPWERTHQVNIMSDIFRNAKTVVVWAGPTYGDSNKALETIRKAEAKNKKPLTRICAGREGSAIRDFCERPYWRRLWVFQELKFARNIVLMCGETLLPWSKFEAFMLHARANGRAPRLKDKVDALVNSPAGAMVELTLKSLDTSLWALLLATKHLRCALAHDKVYALLSVADSGHEHISADYTTSIPLLLNRILRNMHTISPPKEFAQVATQCKTLEKMFGVPANTIFTLPNQPGRQGGKSTCYPAAYRLGPSRYHFSLWWTDRYEHSQVQRLLIQAWDYDWLGSRECVTQEEIQATKSVLIRCCFDVNAGPPNRRYLQTAIDYGHTSVLQLLLEMPDLDIDIKNDEGEDPVYQAIQARRYDMARDLITSGLYDVNQRLCRHPDFWITYQYLPQNLQELLQNAMVCGSTSLPPLGNRPPFGSMPPIVNVPSIPEPRLSFRPPCHTS